MTKINNSEIIQGIIRDARLQSNQPIPSELSNQVIPVIECNPRITRNCQAYNATATNTTSVDVIPATATGATRDFYVIGASLHCIKDATSTSTYQQIQYTDDNGATRVLLVLVGITLTADSQTISISLKQPILIKAGTAISVVNHQGTANIKTSATVYGYFVDNKTA